MRLRWTPEFERQVEAYHLCYTCHDCGYFVEALQTCAHGWPQGDQQSPRVAPEGPDQEIVFCKEFELL